MSSKYAILFDCDVHRCDSHLFFVVDCVDDVDSAKDRAKKVGWYFTGLLIRGSIECYCQEHSPTKL